MERQGSGGNANTERCLAKPIFKRNGEDQILLCLAHPPAAHKSPPFLGKNYKMAGIAPFTLQINTIVQFL
ncbi:MAG: hypothetical protein A2648_01515 [Candidatus Lloydbacteria bacterium RIFCSPHIGHO2_01_FULL_41_20]|uniref:Uncharacterized protein n=1 Tax=Candidatus Lloydbacteria bacterium RIFCSPHIGHO2_01_FULL_41_20 TaxID=1798657 RepID=A0A1G2CTD0_9BACT|nr:MAG: hypothetical protein A2648_01515 [Candidatus Lloydbacteria bacterium RIFCSPHIGHO2_01_FULL_41_20]